MIRRQMRYTTLLEVLIAMTLTLLVLSTLLFFYRQISFINLDIDRVKAEQFQLRYVENRLSDVLPTIVHEKDRAKDFVFFSINDDGSSLNGSQSLIFTFDNGVSLDPLFSNHVLGRLYLDKKKRLTLAYWPSQKRIEKGEEPPMKKEILLDKVKSLRFEFFIPPSKSEEEADLKKQEEKPSPLPKGNWRSQLWFQEFKMLPAMVKVVVSLEGEKGNNIERDETFVYPLVNSRIPVIYD